jgi:hypothetical protein
MYFWIRRGHIFQQQNLITLDTLTLEFLHGYHGRVCKSELIFNSTVKIIIDFKKEIAKY